MEGVIPNSKVVIIPPPDDSQRTDWRKELYLRPGEWIPLVTLTVVIATVILAIIVLVLHLNEKVGALLFDTLDGAKPVHRGRTSGKGEKFLTTSISMHYSSCCNIPLVRSSLLFYPQTTVDQGLL